MVWSPQWIVPLAEALMYAFKQFKNNLIGFPMKSCFPFLTVAQTYGYPLHVEPGCFQVLLVRAVLE